MDRERMKALYYERIEADTKRYPDISEEGGAQRRETDDGCCAWILAGISVY